MRTRKRSRESIGKGVPSQDMGDHESSRLLEQGAGGPRSLRHRIALIPGPTEQKTLALRLCFIGSMILAAIITASVAYTVTKRLEVKAAIKNFESVASSAVTQAQAIAQRKQRGGEVLSSVLGYAFPSERM